MLDLRDVHFFVQVVDQGGFTAASRSLRVSKSTLSHRIQVLEAFLNVRLVNRTSRHFAMTEVGHEFYQRALIMLESAEAAEDVARQRILEPSGTIRVTTPVTIAQFALKDVLPSFLRAHPKVKVVQLATDMLVDIVGEGFDLALRGHSAPLPSSTLIQRRIADVPWLLFAGETYLASAGTPMTPDDLSRHAVLAMQSDAQPAFRLRHESGASSVIPIDPRFISNDMVVLKQSACAGLGIVALPGYVCRAEMAAGALRQILPGWTAADSFITALMPYRQRLLPAVRAFIDHVAQEFPKAIALNPS
ncbi:LysR substrate-binding domain-containing protein [Rhizobium leguminosarum]